MVAHSYSTIEESNQHMSKAATRSYSRSLSQSASRRVRLSAPPPPRVRMMEKSLLPQNISFKDSQKTQYTPNKEYTLNHKGSYYNFKVYSLIKFWSIFVTAASCRVAPLPAATWRRRAALGFFSTGLEDRLGFRV